ncbi:unnamed protein product, partial [Effrenium voratum]
FSGTVHGHWTLFGFLLLAQAASQSEEIWRLQVGDQCRWNSSCEAVGPWTTSIPRLHQRPSKACGAAAGLPEEGIAVGTTYWWVPPCRTLSNGAWCYDTASPGRLGEDDLCACLLDDAQETPYLGNWAMTVMGCTAEMETHQPTGFSTMHYVGLQDVPMTFVADKVDKLLVCIEKLTP